METLNVPQGSFGLARVPRAGKRPLRAWDAADEYVLDHLAEGSEQSSGQLMPSSSVLLVGDSFGALSCALGTHSPTVLTESAAGRQAVEENLERNGVPGVDFTSIADEIPAGTVFDMVIIKVPKSTPHLVDLLHHLKPHLAPGTKIVAAAMAKQIQGSTIDAFEKIIGPTTTSLAKKKARLIHVMADASREPKPNPWPKAWKAHGLTLCNYGGGFSPNKLDAGTSLLLDTIRSIEEQLDLDNNTTGHVDLVDLGCGNGVIGLRVAALLSNAGFSSHVSAIDDSALAVAASQQSWEASAAVSPTSTVSFHHGHRLVNELKAESSDLVIVNPPFHDDRVLGDETAWSMFVDAHKVLRPGGQIIVVGNRHLAYHAKLKKIFGGVNNLASNAKFVVLSATR